MKWDSLAEHGTVTELPQSCRAGMVTGDRVGQYKEFHFVFYCIAVALLKSNYQFQPNEFTTFPSNHRSPFTGQGTLWNGTTSVSHGIQKRSLFLLSFLFLIFKESYCRFIVRSLRWAKRAMLLEEVSHLVDKQTNIREESFRVSLSYKKH